MALTQKFKKWLAAGVILVVVSLLMSGVAGWNPLKDIQLSLSNLLYFERSTNNPVVIIAIDDSSTSEQNLGKYSAWTRDCLLYTSPSPRD